MANLAYYKGEYNPMAQGGDPNIISMYDPQGQQQMINAVQQRQQRFDQGNAAMQAEKARIGELDTYDLPELTKRLNSFESNINDLVKTKYNGDYGAAANEIANTIGTERTNPFYAFNKQKVEMGKSYLDAKMKMGPDFLSAGNPFDVSFSDWQNGKTLQFTPINKNAITQSVAETFKPLSEAIRSTPIESYTPDKQFIMLRIQKGMASPQEVMNFVKNDPTGKQMMQQALASMPELSGVKDQKAVLDAAMQGAYQAIGGTQVDFRENPEYAETLRERAKSAKGTTDLDRMITQTGNMSNPISENEFDASPMWQSQRDKLAKQLDPNATKYEDLRHSDKKLVLARLGSAVPLYQFNDLYGDDAKEISYMKDVHDQMDKNINNLPTGTLVGANKHDSKRLADLYDLHVKGFSVLPTPDPQHPFRTYLRISGIPRSSKGVGKAQPEEIEAMIHQDETAANKNFFEFLDKIDPKYTNGVVNQLKDVNPEVYRQLIGQ
jgi:hypothetical protein